MSSASFVAGVVILLIWVASAIFADFLSPFDPLATNLMATNAPPSSVHVFGTDSLGRDILSRIIYGSREILLVAPVTALLGTGLGTVIGLAQGYYGGLIDSIMGRLIEAFLSLPLVIVAFLFIAAAGSSTLTLVLTIGFSFGLVSSRTVRSAVLQERQQDYVAAAALRGDRASYIIFAEILPNVLGPILVELSVRVGYAIFTIATLSFLGFGVRPPTPDWGADIAANYSYLDAGYWWETLFAAFAIASLITAINLIGDAFESTFGK